MSLVIKLPNSARADLNEEITIKLIRIGFRVATSSKPVSRVPGHHEKLGSIGLNMVWGVCHLNINNIFNRGLRDCENIAD